MNISLITRILTKWTLTVVILVDFAFAEEITCGPRLLCIEIVDERDVGISGVYCQHINSSLYRELRKTAMAGVLGVEKGSPFTGAFSVRGNSGIAVLPVMGSGTEGEHSTALFVDGELVLVHPIRGVKRVEFSKHPIRWQWSKALGRSIGAIKILFEENATESKVRQ